jgi:hypothetical protein
MPAPTRTPLIKGRILRNLTRRGLSLESVQDEEIYSELTDAQNHILDDITPHYDSVFPRSNPGSIIDGNTDPVIPGLWDKALEYKATSEFLGGADQQYFLTRFEQQLRELRASAQRSGKHQPVNREPGIRATEDIGGGKEWPDRDSWWY